MLNFIYDTFPIPGLHYTCIVHLKYQMNTHDADDSNHAIDTWKFNRIDVII